MKILFLFGLIVICRLEGFTALPRIVRMLSSDVGRETNNGGEKYKAYTPVLVDDINSTAATMIAMVKQLKAAGMVIPVCIGVHAIFANEAYHDLLYIGVKEVLTCNTIVHITNKIDLSETIVNALNK